MNEFNSSMKLALSDALASARTKAAQSRKGTIPGGKRFSVYAQRSEYVLSVI